MSDFYVFEPEVPGGLGPRTKLDTSVHPPRVEKLHFVFDGWLGDQLVESFPCFLVTEELGGLLIASEITGFNLAEAEIEESVQYKELYPDRPLPVFKWLKITGSPQDSDLWLTKDHRLAGTRRVLDIVLSTSPAALEYVLIRS